MDSSKWVVEVSSDEPVHQVAIRTIESRLADVEHYLPLAAQRPEEDVEYVHQLRVATRRAVAAIELYRECFPARPRKVLCRQLKRIRKAAGHARDLDVLMVRQGVVDGDPCAANFLATVTQKRQLAQEPLHAAHESTLATASLHESWMELCRSADKRVAPGRATCFGRWARRHLREIVRTFFRAEPEELDDMEALHAFRIEGKRLRYAIELMAAALPDTCRTKLYPQVERLQERLGDINDHAVALVRFRTWRDECPDRSERKYLRKLLKTENKALQRALWRFARWWTPRRSKRLERRLERLVARKRK
jgi:CHAD domain-containing protein